MEPLPYNTRYILELERKELIRRKTEFDEEFGTFCFIFLQIIHVLAILAYCSIIIFLIFMKKIRSKVNMIVIIWALISLVVLGDRSARFLVAFLNAEDSIVINGTAVCQMVAGLGRIYGASLCLVWLYTKYFNQPSARYNLLLYFLMLVPAFVCAYFMFYFYNVDRFIYEAFAPGCDIVSLAAYILVGCIYGLCKIFLSSDKDVSAYPLLMSLASLVTNFPISLITIYLRFNMDISWSYRAHIYFVDLFANLFTASNGFVGLFLVFLYHKYFKREASGQIKQFECVE